jgi:mono/diheme cytochrome c family protein
MDSRIKANLAARKMLFVFLLAVICIVVVYSILDQNKPWVVPPEYKALKNPLQPSESNLSAARELYRDECAQCHGALGKGDGPEAYMHRPTPADLTDAHRMSTVSDGEIFYQISAGRRPMPPFKNRTTEDQRWQLTLLVRSFSQNSVAPETKPPAPLEPPH